LLYTIPSNYDDNDNNDNNDNNDDNHHNHNNNKDTITITISTTITIANLMIIDLAARLMREIRCQGLAELLSGYARL